MVELLSPSDGYLFDTHTDIQNEFINNIHSRGTEKALFWLETVKKDQECSYPNTLTLSWNSDNSMQYTVELSENADFHDSVFYNTKETYIEIGNLKTGQAYFWRVNGGADRSFTTVNHSPRFIKIQGALNVRDLGGNKIRQGMIYRGSAIDTPFRITAEGIKTFADDLGIKTELELRKGTRFAMQDSVAGDKVKRVQLPYRPYEEVFEPEHREGICRIMKFLSDESIYPVYIHCMGGADRTGMIAIYLRALAGESDDEIHTDYELTALSTYAAGAAEGANGFRSRYSDYYIDFLTKLRYDMPDAPLSVSVPAFLSSCGVSEECMQRIRSIIQV